MTLTEFLLARIAEDEERARSPLLRTVYVGQTRADVRELAECEAKRRIVTEYPEQVDMVPVSEGFGSVQYEVPGRRYIPEVLRLLALPYADHPDYDEAWRT